MLDWLETNNSVDCAIVGAGPAGLSCALQATRQGLSIALFEKAEPGGQALSANRIENYPGFPEGISGRDFIKRFLAQVESCRIMIRNEQVKNVSRAKCGFMINTDRGEMSARTVVVASGLVPKRLGVPGEHELEGRSIFYYANPHEILHEEKDVLIIGSGDAAFDQALSFARRARTVTIIMKYAEPCCAPALLKDARTARIKILPSSNVLSIAEKCDRIVVECEKNEYHLADLLIVCVGKMRCFDFLDGDILEAPAAGIFFAGDCLRNRDRHISIAIGDGASAAMAAAEYLHGNTFKTG